MKVTKEELVVLENMRCEELKNTIQLTADNRTYFYRIGELIEPNYTDNSPRVFNMDCLSEYSVGELNFMKDYFYNVLELNTEVSTFSEWKKLATTTCKVCSIDFDKKIYIDNNGIDCIVEYIDEIIDILEDKNKVDVPKNLEHLVDMLGKDTLKEMEEFLYSSTDTATKGKDKTITTIHVDDASIDIDGAIDLNSLDFLKDDLLKIYKINIK